LARKPKIESSPPVTNLQDARAAKAMGLPTNTPFEELEVSALVGKHWTTLEKHTSRLKATCHQFLYEVSTKQNHDKTWALLNRQVQKLRKVFEETNRAFNRATGNPVNTVGQLSDEQEANCQKALEADPSLIILARLLPLVRDYLNFWQEFINEVCESKPGDSLNVEHLFNAPKIFEDY
jgi:hypothetical protein